MYRKVFIDQLNNMFNDMDDSSELILRERRVQAVKYLDGIKHHVLTNKEVETTFDIVAGRMELISI